MEPIRLQSCGGFNRFELKKIFGIIPENKETMLEAWNEYFGD
jgi:hypothetical protein